MQDRVGRNAKDEIALFMCRAKYFSGPEKADSHLKQIYPNTDGVLLGVELFDQLLNVLTIPQSLELRFPCCRAASKHTFGDAVFDLVQPCRQYQTAG